MERRLLYLGALDGSTRYGGSSLTTLPETKIRYAKVYAGGVLGHAYKNQSDCLAPSADHRVSIGVIRITTIGDDFTIEKVAL